MKLKLIPKLSQTLMFGACPIRMGGPNEKDVRRYTLRVLAPDSPLADVFRSPFSTMRQNRVTDHERELRALATLLRHHDARRLAVALGVEAASFRARGHPALFSLVMDLEADGDAAAQRLSLALAPRPRTDPVVIAWRHVEPLPPIMEALVEDLARIHFRDQPYRSVREACRDVANDAGERGEVISPVLAGLLEPVRPAPPSRAKDRA